MTPMIETLSAPAELLGQLRALRDDVLREGEAQFCRWAPAIERASFVPSARNLAVYLALRRRDLRTIQVDLMPYGLSSLGRCESHVAPNLDAVLAALARIVGDPDPPPFPTRAEFFAGEAHLRTATEALFGPAPGPRTVRIMVTLPSEAANDFPLVERILEAGTDVVRINCGHDDLEAWRAMAANVRRAAERRGRPCAIYVDVAGPKVRIEEVLARRERDARLNLGDRVWLGNDEVAATRDIPLALRCSVPAIATRLAVGDEVWIDDGKIGTRVIELTGGGGALLETFAGPEDGLRMRPARGLNFPATDLQLPALSEKDLADLDFIAAEADMVGFSFVNRVEDVQWLERELDARSVPGRPPVAIVLKIETRDAVHNLPGLIVTAASKRPVGVMIARGDLAVNIGYRRMAEIQEEILWLCESAHVPVVWATQVLERLVKKGQPTRGEFTDAAMAERAECVMLNKGPHIVEAIVALDEVLGRMEGHQVKKTSRLRPLHAWYESTP